MARVKLEISKKEFQKIVDELEKKTTFPNTSALWKAVEESDWAKSQSPRPLLAATAYLRAKELGIKTITKTGKRGRQIGSAGIGGTKTPRSEKMKKFKSSFEGMRLALPLAVRDRYANTLKQAEKGSLKAAIKLKCLDCCCYQATEIRDCVITECSLFPHRPYGITKSKEEIHNMDIEVHEDESEV